MMNTVNYWESAPPRLQSLMDPLSTNNDHGDNRSCPSSSSSSSNSNNTSAMMDFAARSLLMLQSQSQQNKASEATTAPDPASSSASAVNSTSSVVTPNNSSVNLRVAQEQEQQEPSSSSPRSTNNSTHRPLKKRKMMSDNSNSSNSSSSSTMTMMTVPVPDASAVLSSSSTIKTVGSSPVCDAPLSRRSSEIGNSMISPSQADGGVVDSGRATAALAAVQQSQEQYHQQQYQQQSVVPVIVDVDAAATASVANLNDVNDADANANVIRRRKSLAARLRANNVTQRIMIKPSDYARSIFAKNNAAVAASTASTASTASAASAAAAAAAATSSTTYHSSPPTPLDLEIYEKHSCELFHMVRQETTDLTHFKERIYELQNHYYAQSSPASKKQQKNVPTTTFFRCCNKFGESLLHLACRRGKTDMVKFLLEESRTTATTSCISARQMLAFHDDYHKTPFHDACWTPTPQFALIDLLLRVAPEQVLQKDIRGHTPLDYVRREDYPQWLKFLWERKALLQRHH